MSLRINHNIAAFDAHRNLTMTTSSLSNSMEKLSSGFRINRASDDPAGLVISEQFRAQIAGFERAIENSEGSMNMIQTAEGALTEINNLLIKMRELAIHAANEGFNDTAQLEADQAEITNSLATIDRIAANTQFGTKNLLDGSRGNVATITSGNSSALSVKESGLTTGTHGVVATKIADSASTVNTTSLGLDVEAGGTTWNLSEGVHNIDVLQSSAGATRSGETVWLTDPFGTNLTLADAATQATVNSGVAVNATATGGTHDGDYDFIFDYWEAGSNAVGNQTLSIHIATGDTAVNVATKLNTAVQNNALLKDKMTFASTGGGAIGAVGLTLAGTGAKYAVKYVAESSTAGTAFFQFGGSVIANRGRSLDQLKMTITTANKTADTQTLDLMTAAATFKTYATMTSLVSEFNRALDVAFGSVVAGAGAKLNVEAAQITGEDKIQLTTADEGSSYKVKVESTGTVAQDAEEILGFAVADVIDRTGTDALVSFDGYTNQINAVDYANTNSVTLENKAGDSATIGRGTVDMTINTASSGIDVGNALLSVTAAKFSVRLDGGPATAVSAGVDTRVWTSGRDEWMKVNYALTSNGGSETISNTDSSLVFQIGASVGQTAKVGIDNTSSTHLGQGIAGNLFTSLSTIDVTTVQGAQDSQRVIDQAINEVSNLRGKLGSFQKNTLESNLRNLRISAQNLTASESAIRDTDMAREMSNFVRYQILLQAGTSMLAQANQVPQVVLSLFR